MNKLISPAHITAGLVAVLVGYTGAAAIVFQAAIAGGAGPAEISSWLWALGLGMGVSGIALSLYYKDPVMIAWSTPGAALLATSLQDVPMPEAIGAFLFCSALITLCGVTGWIDKIMAYTPKVIVSAMLAGVLLRFGIDAFAALELEFPLVAGMILTYFITRHLMPRYVIPLTFFAGLILALSLDRVNDVDLQLTPTVPVLILPVFNLSTLIGVGLPLFLVTMASQNIPGLAMLRGHGYHTPASSLIGWTGVTGLLLAPFGGYAFNLAAITAAICMGKDVDDDPGRRYLAAVWAGIFYIIMGIFGAAVTGLFVAFPQALIMAIAGLALLGTIAGNLHQALSDESGREAAIVTFLVTASGVTLLSIDGAFWGLVIGLVCYWSVRLWRENI